MSAVEGLLDRAIDGHGAVVGVVGSPGIGKSRLVREVSAMAATRHVEVFTGFCESHTSQVPFHAVARLLRAITGIQGLDPQAARARIRAQFPDAEPEDLVLFDDLLGIADPDVELPKIDPNVVAGGGKESPMSSAQIVSSRPASLAHLERAPRRF
jgi:predicted ATPase